MSFLENYEIRPLTLQEPNGLVALSPVLGRGPNAFEVVIATALRPLQHHNTEKEG